MHRKFLMTIATSLLCASAAQAATAGDSERGEAVFRSCVACHSLQPGQHRTGPSLAGIMGRKAGTAQGFRRYSPALRESGLTWDAQSLDAWLADPQSLIPGNTMRFRGISDAQARADLIAYLAVAESQDSSSTAPGDLLDLRRDSGPNNQITAMRYCDDTYTVEVKTGESHLFWEFNLRIKTDSSANGPLPGHPVLIPAGMMGDRAFVVFADPAEISAFIEKGC